MPYKVSVERKDGTWIEVPEIHLAATPQNGAMVEVKIENTTVRAVVSGISTFPSKSPGRACETPDSVTAREID